MTSALRSGSLLRAAALLIATLVPSAAHAQAPTESQRPTSTPYSGDLSIFEYPDRDQKLEIQRVMDLLKLKPGKNVADIGAGSGWFTVRAARRVAPGGTVFAEDINPDAIKYIQDRAKKETIPNIQTVLGTPDDARLAPASVDAVLMLKVYHEIAAPIPFMQRLRTSLRPGARVGIIDRNGTGTDHGLKQDILEKEMTEAGFHEVAHYDFTKKDGQDYFLIFEAK
jgi:cyclopropane fatty-acyl-phospholipid synthase-like methyltransferase